MDRSSIRYILTLPFKRITVYQKLHLARDTNNPNNTMSANNTMRENNTMSSNKTPVLSDNEESNVLLEGNPPNPTTNLDPHLQILLVLCGELDHAIIDNKSCDASALQKKQYRKVPLLGQSFDNPHTTQHSSGGITYGLFKICNRNKRDVVLPFVLESMQDTVLEEEFTNNKANWINSSTSDYANAFGVHMHSLYANIPSHVGKQYFTDLSSDTKKTAYHYRRQLQENESTTDDRLATQPVRRLKLSCRQLLSNIVFYFIFLITFSCSARRKDKLPAWILPPC